MTDQNSAPREIQSARIDDFRDLARRGKNDWWRYLLGIGGIVLFYLIMSIVIAILLVVFLAAMGMSLDLRLDQTGRYIGTQPFIFYLFVNLSFVPLIASIFFVVRVLHRRPLLTLVTASPHVNWRRVAIGFGFWILLCAIAALTEHLLNPGRYQLGSNLRGMLLPALAVLVLTPLQSTAEELLFRGYLLQGLALLTRNPVVLALSTGFLFMLPHLSNPEISAGFVPLTLYYWSFGVLLALVTIRSQGLELAIGMHAGNNLFAGLIANYDTSALTTSSIFVIKELEPIYGLVSFLVMACVFYVATDRIASRQNPRLKRSLA
jgi:membrane protease YdiL (CAAX protease family)